MGKAVDTRIADAGIPVARRHLFLCIGPDCCSSVDGKVLWDHAKKRVKKLETPVLRTKAMCFRICRGGPWLVVYPDGIWYGAMTPERLDRILEEHVERGRPVREWVSAQSPMAAGTAPDIPDLRP